MKSNAAKSNPGELETACINAIRFLSADAVEKAKSGHPGTPMGLAPLGYVLWARFLKHNPGNPQWPDRDRFVLSCGHACMLLYSLLYLTGYDLTLDDIKKFRQWGSRTPGHPEHGLTPGVEATTGPLGQGFANAVGMAIAEQYLASYFNRPGFDVVDHFTYCFTSDGDLMEGIASEAASLAGHLALSKLICFYDDNRITIEGSTDLAFSTEDVQKRFEAYGWHVAVEPDGTNTVGLANLISQARQNREKPSLIIVRTHIAHGSPHKQDTAEAHGAPLGEEEVRLTKENLEWPLEPPFYVPEEVINHYRAAASEGEKKENDWKELFERYREKNPGLAAEWQKMMSRQLPQGWDEALPVFEPKDGPLATRQASGKVLNAAAKKIRNLIGGSGDLAPSNDTYLEGAGDFLKGNRSGRNFHFGVREHAMGGITNGMALHGGIIPYAATFLIFSDYMRPSIRLAALTELSVIYVFTHDSIGLGEDGPTHQPVEHLAALRAIPNMTVIRPADANETREAWRYALEKSGGPVAIVLTRQKLPIFDRRALAGAENLKSGGYILAEARKDPDVILIATGSEVAVALEAREKLALRDIEARVVSMPCREIFSKQPEEYRNLVLPPAVTRRISIEAGVKQGWLDYVGCEGDFLSLERFGASAPGGTLMKELGFSADNVISRVMALMQKK
ncbi:MAG TPA: transketolase [bacterium]|nr:transketolase [bacterium]